MHINKFTYPIFTIFSAPKIHTNLLWDLTFLFLILGGLYFISVFFFRNKLSRLFRNTKVKRQELAPIISNFLFHSSEDPKQEQKEYIELKIEIREYLNSKSFRKIISQILFDLQKDVAGGTRERLFKLYKELELHHDAFQKLESWRWETVAQGILELSQMEVEESDQLIRKFINDRRGVVRKQAELATVSLRADGIDYLLDTTRHSISEWQQLKLIETLGKRKNYRPPEFKGWLLSQNKDVVLFALRLIKHYNQKGAEPSIRQLVKHKNDEVRIAAIQCIVDFNFKSALPVLKSIFSSSSNTVKVNILNAIAILGRKEEISFLQNIAKTESNFIIVGKAQSTINSIVPEMILPSKDILRIEEENDSGIMPSSTEDVTETDGDQRSQESIEVDDIEFYDEAEFQESRGKKSEKIQESPSATFELNTEKDEYGSAMGELLGAVASTKEHQGSKEVGEAYQAIPFDERTKLVDATDEREVDLLEHITENETDSELRFRAFKALQSLNRKAQIDHDDQEQIAIPQDEMALAEHSIFYPLYHYTEDTDAKKILLKEIMVVGDDRELPFLKSLLNEKEKSLVRLARKAIVHLEENTEKATSNIGADIVENITKPTHATDDVPLSQKTGSDTEQDNERLPLELIMLYEELGIAPAHKKNTEDMPFDFELSNEYFIQLHTKQNINRSDE